MKKKKITVIIPTFNEEERIKNSLKSAEFADETIVIDSYSTDDTVKIVKKSNAVLLQRKFPTCHPSAVSNLPTHDQMAPQYN